MSIIWKSKIYVNESNEIIIYPTVFRELSWSSKSPCSLKFSVKYRNLFLVKHYYLFYQSTQIYQVTTCFSVHEPLWLRISTKLWVTDYSRLIFLAHVSFQVAFTYSSKTSMQVCLRWNHRAGFSRTVPPNFICDGERIALIHFGKRHLSD